MSSEILAAAGINPDTRTRDLTEEEVAKLRELIDKNYKVEGDLRREQQLNIKRLIEIGSYRGRRHRIGLPVRGQNTKNNARTRKVLEADCWRQEEKIIRKGGKHAW